MGKFSSGEVEKEIIRHSESLKTDEHVGWRLLYPWAFEKFAYHTGPNTGETKDIRRTQFFRDSYAQAFFFQYSITMEVKTKSLQPTQDQS